MGIITWSLELVEVDDVDALLLELRNRKLL